MDHLIPPMDDTRSSFWQQPSRTEILVTGDHAAMTQAAFDQLSEYSRSMPSGVYPGKMWKLFTEDNTPYLCWYGIVADNPDVCSNNYRKVVLYDWKALLGVTA